MWQKVRRPHLVPDLPDNRGAAVTKFFWQLWDVNIIFNKVLNARDIFILDGFPQLGEGGCGGDFYYLENGTINFV